MKSEFVFEEEPGIRALRRLQRNVSKGEETGGKRKPADIGNDRAT